MPTYWENDMQPAGGAPAPAAAPKPPMAAQQPAMGAAPQQARPRGQQPPGARWWQNPGSAVRPPMATPPPAPGAPPAPSSPPAGGAPPAPYNAGARFNQPPAAPPAAAPAAPPPAAAAAPYNAGARFAQPPAAPPAPAQQPAPPPGAVPAGGGYIQPIASEGNASKVWAAQQQQYGGAADRASGRARLDQMSREDAARNPNASMYGNPGGADVPGGESYIRAMDPGEAGDARNRMAQMMEASNFDRRSKAFGPPPPTGVASYGVAPEGGESSIQAMEDSPEARTRMEEAMAAASDRSRMAPAPPSSIDPGRAAMGLGRGLPPGRMGGRSLGRGRGPVY